MGSRRTRQVVVHMPVGMLKAVRAHARDGLPVTAIMLRVLSRLAMAAMSRSGAGRVEDHRRRRVRGARRRAQ